MPDASESLTLWTIGLTTGVFAVGIISIALTLSIGMRQDAASASNFLREVLRGGNALRLLTVFLVIYAVVILGAINRLSDVVVTLLSSVAAF